MQDLERTPAAVFDRGSAEADDCAQLFQDFSGDNWTNILGGFDAKRLGCVADWRDDQRRASNFASAMQLFELSDSVYLRNKIAGYQIAAPRLFPYRNKGK